MEVEQVVCREAVHAMQRSYAVMQSLCDSRAHTKETRALSPRLDDSFKRGTFCRRLDKAAHIRCISRKCSGCQPLFRSKVDTWLLRPPDVWYRGLRRLGKRGAAPFRCRSMRTKPSRSPTCLDCCTRSLGC